MSRCSAPLGDRNHAPTRVKLAKRAGGWLAAVLPPAPSTESLCVTHGDVPEPSTESLLGVTHDVTHNSMAVGNDTRPKMNRKMLFFVLAEKYRYKAPKYRFMDTDFA